MKIADIIKADLLVQIGDQTVRIGELSIPVDTYVSHGGELVVKSRLAAAQRGGWGVMKVMQLIEEWHAIEGHPGQIDTCPHSLCAEVALDALRNGRLDEGTNQ